MLISSKLILGLIVFILLLHILATINSWYWSIPWIDMPMHFLGGFLVAMVFIWLSQKYFSQFLSNFLLSGNKNLFALIIITLGFVALIGVFWEFSEFLCDIFISTKGYAWIAQQGVADTMSDLFFDFVGGLVFIFIFKIFKNRKNLS